MITIEHSAAAAEPRVHLGPRDEECLRRIEADNPPLNAFIP